MGKVVLPILLSFSFFQSWPQSNSYLSLFFFSLSSPKEKSISSFTHSILQEKTRNQYTHTEHLISPVFELEIIVIQVTERNRCCYCCYCVVKWLLYRTKPLDRKRVEQQQQQQQRKWGLYKHNHFRPPLYGTRPKNKRRRESCNNIFSFFFNSPFKAIKKGRERKGKTIDRHSQSSVKCGRAGHFCLAFTIKSVSLRSGFTPRWRTGQTLLKRRAGITYKKRERERYGHADAVGGWQKIWPCPIWSI